jgi:hypothetical protein
MSPSVRGRASSSRSWVLRGRASRPVCA